MGQRLVAGYTQNWETGPSTAVALVKVNAGGLGQTRPRQDTRATTNAQDKPSCSADCQKQGPDHEAQYFLAPGSLTAMLSIRDWHEVAALHSPAWVLSRVWNGSREAGRATNP